MRRYGVDRVFSAQTYTQNAFPLRWRSEVAFDISVSCQCGVLFLGEGVVFQARFSVLYISAYNLPNKVQQKEA